MQSLTMKKLCVLLCLVSQPGRRDVAQARSDNIVNNPAK